MHEYLLTYEIGGISHYSWFFSKEEMNEFIEDSDNITVTEKLHIIAAVVEVT